MNYANSFKELKKQHFYSKIRKSLYSAEGYLEAVNIVSDDYKVIFDRFKDLDNVVFLIDPPYLSTDCSSYKNYWSLKDYLNVLKTLINTKYFYFTSNKSNIIELCEWIEDNTLADNPFKNAEIVYRYNPTTHNTGYTDIMAYNSSTTGISK